ncbi:MAG: hypothetical protein EZS28_016897 [Streblomastix strix]|uniref:Uncharacterized protein n=1 Tax=Streblomastix strix TaxID=222440 RepID=A0A5J4VZA8_9EUKA|nr:MAG: hypothetical protein EZS28_016897 [Streblomastix strix]
MYFFSFPEDMDHLTQYVKCQLFEMLLTQMCSYSITYSEVVKRQFLYSLQNLVDWVAFQVKYFIWFWHRRDGQQRWALNFSSVGLAVLFIQDVHCPEINLVRLHASHRLQDFCHKRLCTFTDRLLGQAYVRCPVESAAVPIVETSQFRLRAPAARQRSRQVSLQ